MGRPQGQAAALTVPVANTKAARARAHAVLAVGSGRAASSCTACSAGTYSDGTHKCVSCEAGKFSSDGATSCTACPAGQSSSGSSNVIVAGPGTQAQRHSGVHGVPRRQVSEPERQGFVQCLRKRQVSILRRQHELHVMSCGQGTGAYRPGFVCDLLRRQVLSLRGWCELPSVREELLPRRVRPEELQAVPSGTAVARGRF